MAVVLPLVGGVIGGFVGGALFGGSALAIQLGFTLGSMLMSLIFPTSPSVGKSDVKPASLSDVTFTTANEGAPVPIVYGTVKIPGNIIWFGNFKTKKKKKKIKAGKKKKKVTVGYKYYLDVWEALCMGKVSILGVYKSDKKIDDGLAGIHCNYYKFNDGTTSVYPTQPGEYANAIPGVAHIFFKKLYLGLNVTVIPTFYFIVRREFDDTSMPISNHTLSTGTNPAAIVYDILVNHLEIQEGNLDMASFQSAANYYASKNWGLNIVLSRTERADQFLRRVLSYVDSILTYNEEGKIKIKIFKKEDTPSGTIEDDFKSFSYTKPSWVDMPNDFRANFVDKDHDYTVRTIVARNPANMRMTGEHKQVSLDLTAFTDRTIAFQRLYDHMKRFSYPRAQVQCVVPLKYAKYEVGDVITIKNSDFGIDGDFRITSIRESNIDKNELRLELIQFSEKLFDESYVLGDPTSGQDGIVELQPFQKIKVVELPYTKEYEYTSAYAILVSQETGFEQGFEVYVSFDGSSYSSVGTFTTFAQAGTLDEQYPANTYEVDDDIGILYTPYKDNEEFDDLSRAELFASSRIVSVGSELMGFQTHTPEGSSSYRIKGVIRGILWTEKTTHVSGSTIFVADLDDNILEIDTQSTFWVKVVPIYNDKSGDLSQAIAIEVTPQNKARKPYPPTRIEAERNGDSVTITWWPITKEYDGAGYRDPDSYTDSWPFVVEGEFIYKINADGSETTTTDTQITINNANAFTFYVRHKRDVYLSDWATLDVGTSDGKYITS